MMNIKTSEGIHYLRPIITAVPGYQNGSRDNDYSDEEFILKVLDSIAKVLLGKGDENDLTMGSTPLEELYELTDLYKDGVAPYLFEFMRRYIEEGLELGMIDVGLLGGE